MIFRPTDFIFFFGILAETRAFFFFLSLTWSSENLIFIEWYWKPLFFLLGWLFCLFLLFFIYLFIY